MEYRRGRISQDYRRWGRPARLARLRARSHPRESRSRGSTSSLLRSMPPNVSKLSGERSEAERVRCSALLGGQLIDAPLDPLPTSGSSNKYLEVPSRDQRSVLAPRPFASHARFNADHVVPQAKFDPAVGRSSNLLQNDRLVARGRLPTPDLVHDRKAFGCSVCPLPAGRLPYVAWEWWICRLAPCPPGGASGVRLSSMRAVMLAHSVFPS